jgi:hypothetical protein
MREFDAYHDARGEARHTPWSPKVLFQLIVGECHARRLVAEGIAHRADLYHGPGTVNGVMRWKTLPG